MSLLELKEDLWGELCCKEALGQEIIYTIKREDGYSRQEKLSFYFNSYLSEAERNVLDQLQGPVLDIGCGPGRSTQYLRSRNVESIPIDSSKGIAEIFFKRGDSTFKKLDLWGISELPEKSAGGILLNGNNLGLAGNLEVLKEFLKLSYSRLKDGGLLVANSIDYTLSQAEHHRNYQKTNLALGKYPGSIHIRLEWDTLCSPFWDLLLLAQEDIQKLLEEVGFKSISFTSDQHSYFVSARK